MKYCDDAKVLDAMQLKEIVEENSGNATVHSLVFVEISVKNELMSRIYPCYVFAWAEEENAAPVSPDGRKPLMFKCDVTQFANGEFGLLEIVIHEKDFEVRNRVWDKPPAIELRKPLLAVNGILQ